MSVTEWMAVVLGGLAAVDDLRQQTVSNAICAGGLAAGLGCGAWRSGWHGLGAAAAGAVVGAMVFLLLGRAGAVADGDVKLMAAFGGLLGPVGILLAALLSALFGGLLTAGGLLYRPQKAAIPYAPAIVIGSWMVLLGRS
jgi:Flp pilus assembly protein protease CpaA